MNPNLYRIRHAGFEKIETTGQGLDIYAKWRYRVIYDPVRQVERVRMVNEHFYRPKRGLSQLIFNGRHENE